MPTNEERKAVAARLREHQYGDVRASTYEDGMIASWWRLKEALGTEGDDPQEDHTMMFGYLADLIEPEPERTCRMKKVMKRYDSYSCEYEITWFCSECNHPSYKATKPNYCHNCGARVEQ